jgi:heme-degrading monooxygenase HmoA
MDAQDFARTPEPPYYAVIFTSRRKEWDPDGYAEAAQRMLELAAKQPGFLGVDSARGANGMGITVSYWRDEASIAAWKRQTDHAAIRIRGRKLWYSHFEVRVAKVERAYAGPADATDAGAGAA